MKIQDDLDKRAIDRQHRRDISKISYCLACGLPHGNTCQCETWLEVKAGLRADDENPIPKVARLP